MAFFTSGADLDVGIVNQFLLNSNGVVQGWGQAVIDEWDPLGGLPPNPNPGDKYISESDLLNEGWVRNNIMYFSKGWQAQQPVNGSLVWSNSLNNYLSYDSGDDEWKPLGQLLSGVLRVIVFTSSGTWTVPAGVSKLKLTLVAGGGGGSAGGCGASGGGSGAAILDYPVRITPGTVVNITVGNGGTLGNPGENTIVSYSGITLTAYGGGGAPAFGGPGGGGGGAGGPAVNDTGGPFSGSYPVKGPPGAIGSAGNGSEGSYTNFVISGSAGGGTNSSGGNFLVNTGGAPNPFGGLGGGAAGLFGNGPDGGNDADANTGAGGGGGGAGGAFSGGSGIVIIEYF